MAGTDFYATLGVSRDASKKEIAAAYRRLARKYHPDVTGGDAEAEAMFKTVNAAYEVLGDDKTRAAYDKWGDQWQHAEELERMQREGGFRNFGADGFPGNGGFRFTVDEDAFSGGDAGGFGAIFDRIFRGGGDAGFGGFGGGPVKGQDLEHAISVSLPEAFHGATRMIQLQMQGPRGPEVKRLEVKVPAGVETGSRIRLSGKGGPGRNGGPNGDVVLVVTVVADPRFERSGADLITEVPVPLTTAVLGGEVEVPTLAGRVALRIPQATQNGRTFRLAGQGMPVMRTERRGDLLAKVRVVLPEHLTEEHQRLFEELRDLDKQRSGSGT